MLKIALAVILAVVAQATPQQPAPQKPAVAITPNNADEAFILQRLRTAMRFENDGTSRRETEAVIKVQSEAGVQAFGQLAFGYNASTEKIDIVYVRVRKADGSIVLTPPDGVQDLSSPVQQQAPVYTDFRQKHVTVQGLRPGETLEYKTVSVTHTPLAAGQFWTEYDFERRAIVIDEQLDIDVPADRSVLLKTAADAAPKITEAAGRRTYRWASSHTIREKTEEKDDQADQKGVDDEPRRAAVRLTTFKTWEDVGTWYRAVEKGSRVVTPAVRAKAEQLTAGRTSDLERLQALYDFVGPNFRYVSISLGMGRYQPRSADDVLRDQYGDCKDKHNLLATMIESVGLSASTVLINSSSKIDPDFPSPSQFDHAITLAHLPSLDAWMDVTTEVAPFRLLSANLRKKQALVVSSSAPARLVETPADPPTVSLMTTDVDATLGALGALSAQVKLAVRGDAELMFRTMFRSVPAANWKDVIKQLSTASGIEGEVSDWTVSDPASTREPFQVTFKATRTGAVDWTKKQDTFALPFSEMPLPGAADTTKILELGAPTRVDYRFRLQLGPGYKGRAPVAVSVKRDYASYDATYTLEGQQFTAHRQLDLRVGSLPGDRRGDYRAFRRVVSTDGDQALALEIAPSAIGTAAPDLKASELIQSGHDAAQNGNFEQALTLLKRALELEPKHKQGWNYLGDAYMALRQYGAAVEAYNRQLEVNPFDEFVNNRIGYAYRTQRRYYEAEKAFQKQIELNPLDKFAHASLGGVLIEMKRFDAAIPELEKAVALSPDEPAWHVELGTALLSTGSAERALASYAKAVELSPTPTTWNNVAYQLALKGAHLDRALQYAEAAVDATTAASRNLTLDHVTNRELAIVQSLASYWDTLGWVYFAKGDTARAEKLVSASWRLGQGGEVGDHLGQIMEKKGLPADARRLYATALSAEGPDAETRNRLARLTGAFADAVTKGYANDLVQMRIFKLPAQHVREGHADFFVLLGDDARPKEVKFIAGDPHLADLSSSLRTLQLGDPMPEGGSAKVIRRGTLTCETGGCSFILIPTAVTKPAQ